MVSVSFHLMCVNIILVRFGLLNGHLLEKSCLLGLSYLIFVFCLFVILVISRFGFEGYIWVLIASVPRHAYFLLVICLLCRLSQMPESNRTVVSTSPVSPPQ